MVQTGVLGTSATVDAKVQQALDSSGTGAKDISGKAITQIVKATGDNKQALINVKPEELDTVNGFGFVRVTVSVGVAASVTSAQLLGVNPRYAPADAGNQAAVVQVL
jgi:negative regulator of sigma E activity